MPATLADQDYKVVALTAVCSFLAAATFLSSRNRIALINNKNNISPLHAIYPRAGEIIELQQEAEFFGMDWYDPTCHAVEILDAKYEMVQIDKVVNQLEHLNTQQKAESNKFCVSSPNCLMVLY